MTDFTSVTTGAAATDNTSNKKRTSISMDPDVLTRLRQTAEDQGMSVSAFIERAIRRELEAQ